MLAYRTGISVYEVKVVFDLQCWLCSVIYTSWFVIQACLDCVYVSDYFRFLFHLHMVSANYCVRLNVWHGLFVYYTALCDISVR